MQICKQMADVATNKRLFPSSSSDKVYKVYMFRKNELPFCDCMGFIMGRKRQQVKEAAEAGVDPKTIDVRLIPWSCKHTRIVDRETCQWRQENASEYRFDSTCPRCGGEVVEEGAIVYPKDPATNIDDLIALRNELLGIEPPDPTEVIVVDLTELRKELLKGIRT